MITMVFTLVLSSRRYLMYEILVVPAVIDEVHDGVQLCPVVKSVPFGTYRFL